MTSGYNADVYKDVSKSCIWMFADDFLEKLNHFREGNMVSDMYTLLRLITHL